MMKESPFLEKLKHQRELKCMQNQLCEKMMQVQVKETKIAQLQALLAHLHNKEIQEISAVEEETQCSFDSEGHDEQEDMVRRLSDMLRQREEYGVGLHLASSEKDEYMGQLKLKITKMEETISNLASQLQLMEEESITSNKNIEKMEQIIYSLQESNKMKDRLLEDKQITIGELSQKVQNLIIHKQRERELQLIIIQNGKQIQSLNLSKISGEKDVVEVGRMYQALEKEYQETKNQMEKLKNILNNYDWKLFCIETELDLANKQKKQYKYLVEKNQIKLNQYESLLKEQRISIYSLEEENKVVENQNKYHQMQLSHKQIRIDSLLNQLQQLKEYYEHYDQLELKYRVQEKDQQLKELASFLKEKLNENHQLKIKVSNFQQQVQRLKATLEKTQIETYQLEQSIIEHEEIMENQTVRIEQYTQQVDFLNERMNECSLMNILRTKQCEQKFSMLHTTIKEKCQKINELSVEIIQRQIEFNKKISEMECQIQQHQATKTSLNDSIDQNNQLQAQINHLRMVVDGKNIEIGKANKKIILADQNIKEMQENIHSLQHLQHNLTFELTAIHQQHIQLREMLGDAKEELRVQQSQIGILKQREANHIELSSNYQVQLEKIRKAKVQLQSQKQELLNIQKVQGYTIVEMMKEVQYLNSTINEKLKEITDELQPAKQTQPEETVKFQILDEQEQYEVIPAQIDPKIQILKKIDSYRSQVIKICSKYE